jgi:hypothetical protein
MYYAQQLWPLMVPLVEKGYQDLGPDGDFFERALYRGSLKAWLVSGIHEPRPR